MAQLASGTFRIGVRTAYENTIFKWSSIPPFPPPNALTIIAVLLTSCSHSLLAAGGRHQRGRDDRGLVLVLHRGVHREGEFGGLQGIVPGSTSPQRRWFPSERRNPYY